jgi:hypothetical protein
MASAAYSAWVAAGKPLTPCQPIRDYVTRLKLAFPRAAKANLFSWYANDAHYQAVPPQDHTPFSATGWPQASPRWVVFATDVMHRPDLGVDCNVLFPYWLAEAKAGRTPWVKYIIWQAKLYDVRNGWKPVANSGHFDHIHKSIRTDHLNTSLGTWSIVPGSSSTGGDDMIFAISDGNRKGYAGRAGGGTYEFAAKAEDLEQWRKDQGGVATVYVPEADVRRRLGIEVSALMGGGSGGTSLTEEQVRDIAEQEAHDAIAGATLVPPAIND